MIFVTVGTHEQQFNRLVKQVDLLKRDGIITEDVFIQTGYSTYIPRFCAWSKFCSYQEMVRRTNEAHILISHGGPSSFLPFLQLHRIPVIVPRRAEFGEHVNDHQVEFCHAIEEQCKVQVVDDMEDLAKVLQEYDTISEHTDLENSCNTDHFVEQFTAIVEDLFKDKKKK